MILVNSDQIVQSNQDFAERISEQAAATEETSATMEEMSTSIRQTAAHARDANQLAQETKALGESGSAVMGMTIQAMDEIHKASAKIANICGVIEEIAFQTNLLSLNAAVEAARAGEHGRGFDVVASEIQNLSQMTRQSAKEITEVLADSSTKTARGVTLAQDSSTKLTEIIASVKKVANLMDEVSSATQEQASGINQVNSALSQIDQATQQNTALFEEAAVAAEQLASEARELAKVVCFFKTDCELSPVAETVRPLRTGKNSFKECPRPALKAAIRATPLVRQSAAGEDSGKSFQDF